MIIRVPTANDWDVIETLNEQQGDFKLKNIDECIIDRIVYAKDGRTPIAYGIVKKIAEAIILTNSQMPKITRARAMRELMHYAELGATKERCMQLQCFVADETLARTLEKNFGFVRTKDIVLAKDLL